MPRRPEHLRQPARATPPAGGGRGDGIAVTASIAAVAAANVGVVHAAFTSSAAWLYVLFVVPIANAAVAAALVFAAPAIGRAFGVSVHLPGRWVVWACATAVFVDLFLIC